MKRLVFGLMLGALLTGCAHQQKRYNETSDDLDPIGYDVLNKIEQGHHFDISVTLVSGDPKEAEKYFSIGVAYGGFPEPRLKERSNLTFKGTTQDGDAFTIDLRHPGFTPELLQEIEEMKKTWGKAFSNTRNFFITRMDYSKLACAKTSQYQLKSDQYNVVGLFTDAEISKLKEAGDKLAPKKSFKSQTQEEIEAELKNIFADFEILKKGETKGAIEKYFHTKFTNSSKNPETGMIEEVVNPKLAGKDLGPMIVGFDNNNQLVYTRHYFDKSKITFLKSKS